MAMRKHAAAALDGRANFIRIARKWARIAVSPCKSNLGLGIQIHAEARRREDVDNRPARNRTKTPRSPRSPRLRASAPPR